MRVAYVTDYDAQDIKMWSGTAFYIGKSLEQQSTDVEYIGPLRETISNKVVRKCKRHYHELFGKNYLKDPEPFILNNYANQVAKKLKTSGSDVILSATVNPIAYLKADKPIAFWADATFANILEFYPQFSNLCNETVRAGHHMERQALQNCQLAIYSSDWAAQSAIENYHANPEKVKVIPFGANISSSKEIDGIRGLVRSRSSDTCKLLFIGLDWYRKGGEKALDITKHLNLLGIPTELTIVGCQPNTEEALPEFVKSLGFISKHSEVGRQKLTRLLSETHFLLLPSRADCTPIVLAEANSFGVPALATGVGGIPTIISPGVNGMLFELEDSVSQWSSYISHMFTNYSNYELLAISAFEEYQKRLSWASSGKALKELLTQL